MFLTCIWRYYLLRYAVAAAGAEEFGTEDGRRCCRRQATGGLRMTAEMESSLPREDDGVGGDGRGSPE